ncbi:MAG: hypothetical protein IJW86_01105 [Clostridia bacterium]|nr:hypothetical protein [Clostridia bacterium]
MKKALAIFLLFAVLLMSGAVWTFADAYKEQDNVIFAESTVYGDIKYADGIDVTRNIHLDDARWKSVCSINDGKVTAETDFTYYDFGWKYEGGPDYDSIWLSTVSYPDFGSSVRNDKKITEERKKLQDDFDELTKDSLDNPVTVTFKLRDYYEYYPIGISLWLPECTNIYGEADYEAADNVVKQFREFFKIPVPDSEVTTVKAAVSYGAGGNIETITEKTHNYFFNTISAVCDSAAYFTFDNKFPDSDEKIDTSLIPGGYGIYRLPYDRSTDEDLINDTVHTKVHADKLEMVYALSEDDYIFEMMASFDKTKIYLLTNEGGKYYFTVVDEKTMTDLQKFELDMNEGSVSFHSAHDGYVVITRYSEQSGNDILLFEENNGSYEKKADIYTDYTIFDSNIYWDGERLVAVKKYDESREDTDLWGHYELSYNCGFTLTVFDSEKALYCGNYKSSLDAGAEANGSSIYFCTGVFDDEEDLIVTIK